MLTLNKQPAPEQYRYMTAHADEYWSKYAFTDSYDTQPKLLDYGDLPSKLPEPCSAWSSSGNTARSYGQVIAYPANHLQAKCHADKAEQQDNAYSCEEDPVTHQLEIKNFWSTTAVNESTKMPVSRVLVDVLVLDYMNQTVSKGDTIHRACAMFSLCTAVTCNCNIGKHLGNKLI